MYVLVLFRYLVLESVFFIIFYVYLYWDFFRGFILGMNGIVYVGGLVFFFEVEDEEEGRLIYVLLKFYFGIGLF